MTKPLQQSRSRLLFTHSRDIRDFGAVRLKGQSGGVVYQYSPCVVLGSLTKWSDLPRNIFKISNFTELMMMMPV
jgi:arginine repressor